MARTFDVTPAPEVYGELVGAGATWTVNPLNVVLARPQTRQADDGGMFTVTEILFVNTIGPQSSIVVSESPTRVKELLNDTLRGN